MGAPVEIVLVYQSLLGIYGDRGNATVLAKRLQWRGYDATLTVVEPGDSLPDTGQVYLLGGGEDAAQISAVDALRADGGLHRAVDRGAAVFAVCAGYQIIGYSFTVGERDEVIEGLGLLDVTTTRGPVRAVGEILTRWHGREGEDALLTGFENHGGYTTLGPQGVDRRDLGGVLAATEQVDLTGVGQRVPGLDHGQRRVVPPPLQPLGQHGGVAAITVDPEQRLVDQHDLDRCSHQTPPILRSRSNGV